MGVTGEAGLRRAADMHYGVLAERMRYFKESEEGNETMCRAFEEKYQKGREEGLENGRIGTAQKMLAAGKLALEEIAEYSSLPLEKVKRMAAELRQ